VGLIVGYAAMFAVKITVVRLVIAVEMTGEIGKMLTEPSAPTAIGEEVFVEFHPYELGRGKTPPVNKGKGLWIVKVSALRVVKFM
jgi:hypothetical protein